MFLFLPYTTPTENTIKISYIIKSKLLITSVTKLLQLSLKGKTIKLIQRFQILSQRDSNKN